MSDEIKHEQPSAGGRYIRQPDGSLVREQTEAAMPAVTETTTEAAPAARAKPTRGK
ncbi:hypothetical protein [Bradyrhizobium sp. 191]|uniref:hypothetical protein n=1 Tax=Bradyrhizobium sp. 191 TaxID=2782659 RepID=UPI001FFED3D0|nr:hypothetical protein [Bradyrhizobium sp. 191]UPJ65231.1 hypothetical protein IVB23_35800 [Bradyrhizobium sp. 191]